MDFQLETERLILRVLQPADLPYFVAYRNDPAVSRYQSWYTPYEEMAGRRFIAENLLGSPDKAGKWFQIGLVSKAVGHLIGDCGVGRSKDGQQAEIGYSLMTAFQGQGLMSEGVSAILSYYFESFGLHRISATCDIENIPSQRLLERLGFRQEGKFIENYYDPMAHTWRSEFSYAILKSEWGRWRPD